ncbi:MAG: 4-alpha-glucanotransferase [Balneolaceae bacterium]
MRFPRSFGTLAHPTSFPSRFGMGDFGPEAFRFIHFLQETGQTIWQVLPLGTSSAGNSPYTSYSAFAGNYYLISPEVLVDKKLITPEEANQAELPVTTVADFKNSYAHKDILYRKAFERFRFSATTEQKDQLSLFEKNNAFWLDNFCLFMACLKTEGGKPWNQWDNRRLVRRVDEAIKEFSAENSEEIRFQTWMQFEFYNQWKYLKNYANKRNIRIVGDIPIFVDHNSADVWGNPSYFEVDEYGNRQFVSGVPPDYFSETGQLWGSPLYKWNIMEKSGYSWWIERFRQMFKLYDAVRVDHFRGFDEYWSVPATETTAEKGEWKPGPGEKFFRTIKKELGEIPVIAEDLGVITPGVERLRDQFNFPGMKVLQFAFNSDPANGFLPHNFSRNCVVYTGTHDNDTTIGWYRSAPEVEKHRMREYTRSDGTDVQWELIRLGMLSSADQAIFPLQDFMNLDSDHRMNTPGTAENNWQWRYTPEMLQYVDALRIKNIAEMANRGFRPPES